VQKQRQHHERDCIMIWELQQEGTALLTLCPGSTEPCVLGRVFAPFERGEHTREDSVVAEVEKGIDRLR